jgi:hypothetical protein
MKIRYCICSHQSELFRDRGCMSPELREEEKRISAHARTRFSNQTKRSTNTSSQAACVKIDCAIVQLFIIATAKLIQEFFETNHGIQYNKKKRTIFGLQLLFRAKILTAQLPGKYPSPE